MIRQRFAERLSLSRRGRRTSGGSLENPAAFNGDPSVSSEEEEEQCRSGGAAEKKPWQRANREVYEEQLEKMQEQLINTMLENQALQAELDDRKKKPSSSRSLQRELDELKRQNDSLRRQLRESCSTTASLTSNGPDKSRPLLSTRMSFEDVSIPRTQDSLHMKNKKETSRFSYGATRDSIYHFLSLFSDDARTSSNTDVEEETPLTAKRLKDNLSRAGKAGKPLSELFRYARGIMQWKNTAESLVVFLIYMYCVWNGWIIQLVLLVAVIKLSLNYLYISGLAEHFGFGPMIAEEDVDEVMGLADRFHLVKQVAQTVQNVSGTVADSLEKLRNLILWRDPEAAHKLYSTLWCFLLITLFLPNSYTLTLAGLGIGFKIFIIGNIYHKYPKVKEEFDSVAQIWQSLPTDADLVEREGLTHEQLLSLRRRPSGESSSEEPQVSEECLSFCSRFNLPLGEAPLPGFEGGKKCSLMDLEHPLLGSKGGRIFLTYSFLCFERSTKPKDLEKILMPLVDVSQVVKAKPFAVMPGSGMAIEVSLKTAEKPVMFGAILSRDQVLDSILTQGLILGLPWGADPDSHAPSSPRPPDHAPSSPGNQNTTENSTTAET